MRILLILTVYASIVLRADGAEDLGPRPRDRIELKRWSDRAWAMSAEISDLLKTNKNEDLATAVAKTHILLDARLTFVTGGNGDGIIKQYAAKERYEEIVAIADYGILSHSDQTKEVAILQQAKVSALTQLKRHDQAIAAAKSYYNVATMAGTAEAIQCLTSSLVQSGPQYLKIAEQFREEQIMFAEPVGIDKLKKARARTAVLESIKIDSTPYDAAITKRSDMNLTTLFAKGNLLLLADRVAEAQTAFDTAMLLAKPKELPVAAENVARSMRAVDGSIGRANSWIESLGAPTTLERPKKDALGSKE